MVPCPQDLEERQQSDRSVSDAQESKTVCRSARRLSCIQRCRKESIHIRQTPIQGTAQKQQRPDQNGTGENLQTCEEAPAWNVCNCRRKERFWQIEEWCRLGVPEESGAGID